jgi:hypothetical protein
MRTALARAGTGISAACAFAVAVAVPAELGEGERSFAGSEHALPRCAGIPCEPGPAGLVERIDAQLAPRMPALDDLDRRLLARTIVTEAQAARIDPLLVLALIRIESGFDPGALSRRGARGLMQLRERTMRREAQRAGLSYDSPHDPIANVQAGVRYLRRLLDAFGRQEVALMAYNAGPNRILGYMRRGAIPDRFRVYPRRVNAEIRRLQRSIDGGMDAPTLVASAPLVAAVPE